ncbi:hypothetical protein DPMN_099409 [Dreissena polymorpha]|uniref:Reverse transcriptase domain-containing protein n=1 Tax=Dreissena polymorpha TaxID=45954 RepID=A0A9D4R6I8_DREPO|nr:hypothetical protein DPMN_099409 [Dreissena polymorpha]
MLDLQKAFDTVDHDILCRKLRAMGVESVEWFRSYLADRTHIAYKYFSNEKEPELWDFGLLQWRASSFVRVF